MSFERETTAFLSIDGPWFDTNVPQREWHVTYANRRRFSADTADGIDNLEPVVAVAAESSAPLRSGSPYEGMEFEMPAGRLHLAVTPHFHPSDLFECTEPATHHVGPDAFPTMVATGLYHDWQSARTARTPNCAQTSLSFSRHESAIVAANASTHLQDEHQVGSAISPLQSVAGPSGRDSMPQASCPWSVSPPTAVASSLSGRQGTNQEHRCATPGNSTGVRTISVRLSSFDFVIENEGIPPQDHVAPVATPPALPPQGCREPGPSNIASTSESTSAFSTPLSSPSASPTGSLTLATRGTSPASRPLGGQLGGQDLASQSNQEPTSVPTHIKDISSVTDWTRYRYSKEFRSNRTFGQTVWYRFSGQQPIEAPPPSLQADAVDLFLYESRDEGKVWIWIRTAEGSWRRAIVGEPHPTYDNRRLHILESGSPSWVTKQTLGVYNSQKQRKQRD